MTLAKCNVGYVGIGDRHPGIGMHRPARQHDKPRPRENFVSTGKREQSKRSAWEMRLRNEALHMARPEVSHCVEIGRWIASYADPDGTNAHPSTETLAILHGCSEEFIGRGVRVLMGLGVLGRKRRPNDSSMYTLITPAAGQRLDWDAHLHHWTDNRQARQRRKAKEEGAAKLKARTPSADGVRNPSPDGVQEGPEPVRGRDSRETETRPRTLPEPVRGRIAEPVRGGPYQVHTPYGSDQAKGPETVDVVPQPQVGAGGRESQDEIPGQQENGPAAAAPGTGTADAAPAGYQVRECPCGQRIVRPDRDRCAGCLNQERNAEARAERERTQAEQVRRDIASAAEVFGTAVPARALAPVPGQGKPVQTTKGQWPGQRPLTMSLLDGGLIEDPAAAAGEQHDDNGWAVAR